MARFTRRRVFREFIEGRSMLSIARRYGLTTRRVEDILREYRADKADLEWWWTPVEINDGA